MIKRKRQPIVVDDKKKDDAEEKAQDPPEPEEIKEPGLQESDGTGSESGWENELGHGGRT